jgi:hypothetical protein
LVVTPLNASLTIIQEEVMPCGSHLRNNLLNFTIKIRRGQLTEKAPVSEKMQALSFYDDHAAV